MEPLQNIDRRSYILGMVAAFAECVQNECKKVALSPPLSDEELDLVAEDAGALIGEFGCEFYFEQNPELPEDIRKNWLVIFKRDEAFADYMVLRSEGYNCLEHIDRFADVLSFHTAFDD